MQPLAWQRILCCRKKDQWQGFPLCCIFVLFFFGALFASAPCDKVYLALDLEFEFDVIVVCCRCWSAGLKAVRGGVREGVARRGSWSVWVGKVGERKLHKSNQLTKELKANGPQLPASLYLPPTTAPWLLCHPLQRFVQTPFDVLENGNVMSMRSAPSRWSKGKNSSRFIFSHRKKEKKNVLLAVNPSLPMPRLNNPLQE